MHFLCADIGTTSLKIGIISDSGEVVSFCRKQFENPQDPFIGLRWYEKFLSFEVQKMVRDFSTGNLCPGNDYSEEDKLKNTENRFQKRKIDGICISGNGPTVCLENGRTVLWNQELPSEIMGELEKLKKNRDLGSSSLFMPRFYAIKNLFKNEYDESGVVLSGPEFLIYKLTGKAVSILPEERFKPAYWNEEELKNWGIEPEKIPAFVNSGAAAGNITREVKDIFGVNYEIPVICGGPDFVTALIGTGTVKPGRICDRCGSSEGINLCTEKPVFADGVRTLPSVVPGLWNLGVLIPESGSLITEFENQMEVLEGKKLTYYEIIDYCFEDRNSEGWRILTELEKKAGQALRLLKNLCAENNLKIDDFMSVAGGQAKNQRWMAEKACGAGIKIKTGVFADSELLGNAILGAVALGKYKNLQEAAEKMVREEKLFNCEKTSASKMKVYKIPENLKTIIFDIDSTLYTSSAYAFEQVDVQIRQFAKETGISAAEARNKISQFRKKWRNEHNGQKISLGNAFTYFGVPIEKSIQMRKELLEPGDFLNQDIKLIETIKKLKEKFKIICVTNNPVLPAKKTLRAIGVEELIPDVIGLDTCGKSKPALEPFELALKITETRAEECLSVGDRYDMDLALPLKMGMGGILVTGVKDVYAMPELLM